jgi:hypothetical protein
VQGGYSWCSQNTKLIPDLIKTFLKPTGNATNERCLAFNASSSTDNSSALTHTSCANDQLPFICEPICSGPTCPAAANCVKNVTYCTKISLNILLKDTKYQLGISFWCR